jgi:hypothetical protein
VNRSPLFEWQGMPDHNFSDGGHATSQFFRMIHAREQFFRGRACHGPNSQKEEMNFWHWIENCGNELLALASFLSLA